MNDRFIQTQKLNQVLDPEMFVFLFCLGLFTFLFYKLFLKDATPERHISIKNQLKDLAKHFAILAFTFTVFWLLLQASSEYPGIRRLLPYLGFLTFLSGAYYFVRTCRLIVLQYLFLGSMRAGVPLLLVNIFSLILSVVIGFWTVSNIFGVQLTPLLATSAAFSIILGLALQDTLGNLFAGISLQVDKTFEIGDWLEIMNGPNKIVGQVKELSWRSTLLIGFAEEMITIPNKLVSLCQVSNFSVEGTPIIRSQTFKFGFNADIPKTIALLVAAVAEIPDIRITPAPSAFVLETNDYGISIKLIYFIDNYGLQYSIGDKVVTTALDLLSKNGIQTARPNIHIQQL